MVARPHPLGAGAAATCAPVDAWSAYALDARVMLIRVDDDRCVPDHRAADASAQWLTEGHELGWPTADDLAYHLTTLFPPVRPQGLARAAHVRRPARPVLEGGGGGHRARLLTDASTRPTRSTRAIADTADLWVDAAQLGLGHPDLARSRPRRVRASPCRSSRSAGVDPDVLDLVGAYDERWVRRGRIAGRRPPRRLAPRRRALPAATADAVASAAGGRR